MRCPVDETQLVMSERQGIEIDYCPSCRGVWLDRGELDKILDRSVQMHAAPPAPAPPPQQAPPQQSSYERYDDRRQSYPQQGYSQQPHYKKKKRESWLSELFD